MIETKSVVKYQSQKSIEAEANALIDYLTTEAVRLGPEERPRDSLSAPLIPACNRQLTPMEIKQVINSQIPKKWRKQISEVVWR